jgi:hypothetical protein
MQTPSAGGEAARKGLRPKGLSYSGTFESTGLPERVGMRTAQKTRRYRNEERARCIVPLQWEENSEVLTGSP